MLFNSYFFIFCFLPVCWAGYWWLHKRNLQSHAFTLLTLSSLIFYMYWDPVCLALLIASIGFNYTIAGTAIRSANIKWVHFGAIANLLSLAYFKYAIFFADTASSAIGIDVRINDIILPLGISFFTFHQITYLYDSFNRVVPRVGLRDYTLYIAFFPQLIAGPIVRAREFIPQLSPYKGTLYFLRHTAIGLSLFSFGLFKKSFVADEFAIYANKFFMIPVESMTASPIDSWVGSLCYTFQLYFDFSGYSDMALGLALLFGFRLPINFYSPYKSLNISEFWKRWHMSMSRFFRDYLYIPLGGSRCSKNRTILNLLITMILVGFWHGAGWTFIIWGAMHGIFLAIHRIYRWGIGKHQPNNLSYKILSHILTFIAIVSAWVFFRATSLEQAAHILGSMFGFVPSNHFYAGSEKAILYIIMGYAACMTLPSSMAYFRMAEQEGPIKLRFRPHLKSAIAISVIFCLSLMMLSRVSEFLYFQF